MKIFSMQNGFTLIELLTVVVLISIVAIFAIPMPSSVTKSHSLNKSVIGLMSILNEASNQAKQQSRTVTIHMNQNGVNTASDRYWQPNAQVQLSSNSPSELYIGPEGFAQNSLVDPSGIAPFTLVLCLTNEDSQQLSKSVVIDRNMFYAVPGIKTGC